MELSSCSLDHLMIQKRKNTATNEGICELLFYSDDEERITTIIEAIPRQSCTAGSGSKASEITRIWKQYSGRKHYGFFPVRAYWIFTWIHRKKSEHFPVGILLPDSGDLQCFPAGSGDQNLHLGRLSQHTHSFERRKRIESPLWRHLISSPCYDSCLRSLSLSFSWLIIFPPLLVLHEQLSNWHYSRFFSISLIWHLCSWLWSFTTIHIPLYEMLVLAEFYHSH